MNESAHIMLAGQRRLTYREQGDVAGWPVLLFHGVPGSRLQHHPDMSIAQRAGVRLITVDRPGYGLSTAVPRRSLLDWPADVGQLADALGIECFSVIDVSGGGVFALACASRLGSRLDRVVLVSCPAPFEVPGVRTSLPVTQRLQFALAARAPWLLRLLFGAYLRSARKLTPAALRRKLLRELSPVEQQHLGTPGFVEMLLADARESGRGGPAAIALELGLIARPWGFSCEEIRVPVRLWQGEEDTSVSRKMGSYLAQEIPDCEAVFLPGEGHLAGFTHWEEILRTAARV